MENRQWNGFHMEQFDFEGRDASVVYSPEYIRTSHWLYKMEYRDAFPSLEIEMLRRGWNVAWIQNTHRWAPHEDLKIKKIFADYLSEHLGFDCMCVPVGMSSGGVFAVDYAAMYPRNTAGLYLDAPVLNLLSTPGGLGKAKCDSWNEFTRATGMTMSDLICFREHPMDMIPVLVKNRIPVVMVYGTADDNVPYEENGLLLEKAYRKNGVELLTIRKEGCGHHPHGLENPKEIADFIEENCI